jgi:hypothetical protein
MYCVGVPVLLPASPHSSTFGRDFVIKHLSRLASNVSKVRFGARLLIVELEALGRQIDGTAAV